MKKIFCALLITIILVSSNTNNSFAMEQNDSIKLESSIVNIDDSIGVISSLQQRSTTFSTAIVNFSFSTEGLHININTGTTMTASVIGVKDIKIQKKGLFGIWSTVATSDGGELYDTNFISVRLTYTGAEVGENYRVKCTHYANVDEYRELDHETEMVTFNY